MRKTTKMVAAVLSSCFLWYGACYLGIVLAAGEGKADDDKLSQSIIAYGFLRANYADYDQLLSLGAGLTVTQDLRAMEKGLDSLKCDVPIRLAFPHRVITVESLQWEQWVGTSGKERSAPMQGTLFVVRPAQGGKKRILAILSSVAPERTSIFWLEAGYSTKLVYDSFTRGEIRNEPRTMIGAVVAARLEKGGDVLLREWAEPGSRGQTSGALGRTFQLDLTRGTVTLKGQGTLPQTKPHHRRGL